MNRPDQQPTPKPRDECCPDQYEECHVHMHGVIHCPKPCPPKMCTKMKHLPCNVEGEQIMGQIQQFLNQNAGYTVAQVLDHGHDGWTVIIEGPC